MARGDQSRLHRTDGSIVYGRLTGFDPESRQFTIRDGTTETVVKEAAMADVFLSPLEPAGKSSTDAVVRMPERTLRLVYRDGSRFSGMLMRIEDTQVTMACPGVKEALRLPLAELRSLISLRPGERPPEVPGKLGRLEMEGVSLKGRLVSGEGFNRTPVVWSGIPIWASTPVRCFLACRDELSTVIGNHDAQRSSSPRCPLPGRFRRPL